MLDPILSVRLSIQLRALDVDVLVVGVEVDVANRGFFAGELVGEGNFFEEGRDDEVDVLAGVGKDALRNRLAWCLGLVNESGVPSLSVRQMSPWHHCRRFRVCQQSCR